MCQYAESAVAGEGEIAEWDASKLERFQERTCTEPISTHPMFDALRCNQIHYPKIFFDDIEEPMIVEYVTSGSACTVNIRGPDGPPEEANTITVNNCNCTDPDNFDFYDEGRF